MRIRIITPEFATDLIFGRSDTRAHSFVVECASKVEFMKDWSINKVINYCTSNKWKFKIL